MLVVDLVKCRVRGGGFGYKNGSNPNLSTTQYAVLGLRSAGRLGIKAPPGMWKEVLQFVLGKAVPSVTKAISVKEYEQEAVESSIAITGFGYDERYKRPAGSMTLAGLACLAICRGELNKGDQLSNADSLQISQVGLAGMGWIQENYNIRASTPEGLSPIPALAFYYLYGIERAMVLWGVEEVGGHDWYYEGAGVLLSWQKQDGSWVGPHGSAIIDTAWALLFLKRGTLPVETEHRPRVATGVGDR